MTPMMEFLLFVFMVSVIPAVIEVAFFWRKLEKDMKPIFSLLSLFRRSPYVFVFFFFAFGFDSAAIPILVLLILDVVVGIVVYKALLSKIELKTISFYVLLANVVGWTTVYGVFYFLFQ